jgi:hypothetical protein
VIRSHLFENEVSVVSLRLRRSSLVIARWVTIVEYGAVVGAFRVADGA